MSPSRRSTTSTEPVIMRADSEQGPVTLRDYALVLWRHKVLMAVVVGLGVAVALGYTLRQPRVYESTTSLLVPREGGGAGGLVASLAASGALQQLPGLSFPSLAPNRDLLIGVLKSRTMTQRVAEQFKLQERYRAKRLEEAARVIQEATAITVSREGLLLLTVEETDPGLAAAIANFYAEELERFVTKLGSGEASRQRIFISERLALTKQQLVATEDALRRFQEQNKAIILQDQTRGAIEAAARLKGEIMATEVQLQVLRSFATESNSEIIFVKRRLEEMRRQLAQVEYGDRAERVGARRSNAEITVPFVKVPQLAQELARIMRDVKTHETVVALLTQQFEQAKITEAKDLPTFQVLDTAIPAMHASKPRLRLNVLIGGFGGLLAALFLAFVAENIQAGARPRTR